METKIQNEELFVAKHQKLITSFVAIVSAALCVMAIVVFLQPINSMLKQNLNVAMLFELIIIFLIGAGQLCYNSYVKEPFYKPHLNARMILCSACLLIVALLIHSNASILWTAFPFVPAVASCFQTIVHQKPSKTIVFYSTVLAFIVYLYTILVCCTM